MFVPEVRGHQQYCCGTNTERHGIAHLLFRTITRPRVRFSLCSILGTARRQDSGAMGHFSIAETGQFSQSPKAAHCAWSPDAKWLVFSGARGGYKDESALHPHNPQPYGDLYVMRADGSDVRQLTDDQYEDGTATFIPMPKAGSAGLK